MLSLCINTIINMKKIRLYLSALTTIAFLSACETADLEPQGTSFIALEAFERPQEVPDGGVLNREVKVYAANVTDQDRTLNLIASNVTLDATAYDMPATVTVPAGSNEGTFTITVRDDNLDTAIDKGITINLEPTAEISTGDSFRLNVSRACPGVEQKLRIAITFDRYPEEVYWRVQQNGSTVWDSTGGNGLWGAYAGAARNSTINLANCLTPGDYTFQIYDQFQDGAGPVLVTLPGNVVVFSSDGDYGFTPGPISFTVE